MDGLISNKLLAEAERKDTVFRLDYDVEQRRGFPPFTFFAWGEHKTEIDHDLPPETSLVLM